MTMQLHKMDPVFLEDVHRLMQGDHYDPHRFLGLHTYFDGKKVIRLYRPHAKEIYLEVFGEIVSARKVHEVGIFEYVVPFETRHTDYRIYHQNGLLGFDPYTFMPVWGDIDSYLFGKGTHYEIYQKMGSHIIDHQGVIGVSFVVWAPSAKRVSLVADFNFWDGRVNPMRSMGQSGVWELFVPGIREGERYKFEIKTQGDELRIKADPYAFSSELRPLTASVVTSIDSYTWKDEDWIQKRVREANRAKPVNVYEVHLGSWKLSHGHHLNYKELAHELTQYCLDMGYTHVELLPILEHPLDESWGYQVSGFYAPTSRFGTFADFQYFVDYLHRHNLGIFLDWVPGHFPTDDFSLARFDGTALYEHEDPRQGFHPHWSTHIFNFGRHEVTNFLLGSALFWLDKMHIDGLRVDAVASMIYLDYGREEGMWIPNREGGRDNLEAIEFLKHLNSIIHKEFPGITMIAEESTAFAGITQPVEWGGLGFDLKWNMGWMNDTLRYFNKDPIYRSHHHNDLTFGLLYAFSEKFMCVLSHDEVVHGKGSLLSKMPGDLWQKFANLRLLISYMICQPGKKLLFMGGEIGQWNEWNCKEEVHWFLLQYPVTHEGVQKMVKDINKFYLAHSPLWEKDFDFRGFEWVNLSDTNNSVISYRRKGNAPYELLCVHNFTPTYFERYFLPLSGFTTIEEVFNSDAEIYGGSGKKSEPIKILPTGIEMALPPLSTMIFKISSS